MFMTRDVKSLGCLPVSIHFVSRNSDFVLGARFPLLVNLPPLYIGTFWFEFNISEINYAVASMRYCLYFKAANSSTFGNYLKQFQTNFKAFHFETNLYFFYASGFLKITTYVKSLNAID